MTQIATAPTFGRTYSVAEMARKMGVTVATVHNLIAKNRVASRTNAETGIVEIDAETSREVIETYRDGMTISAAADELDCSYPTLIARVKAGKIATSRIGKRYFIMPHEMDRLRNLKYGAQMPVDVPSELAIDESLLAYFQTHGRTVRFKKGSTVFAEGVPNAAVYLITRGMVLQYKLHLNGDQTGCGLVRAGDVMALDTCYANEAEHVFSADAITDCQVIVLHKSRLNHFAEQSAENMRVVFGLLSQLVLKSQLSLSRFASYTVAQRIAHFMLEHDRLSGSSGTPLSRAITQDVFGLVISATRVSINKTIGDMVAIGMLGKDGSRPFVADASALERLIAGDGQADCRP